MILLGLLMLLVVAVVIVAIIARGDDPSQIDLGSFTIETTFTGVFAAGALTVLVGVLGLMVLTAGIRRSRRRRSELHRLRDRVVTQDASTATTPEPSDGQPKAADSWPRLNDEDTSRSRHRGDADDSAPRER